MLFRSVLEKNPRLSHPIFDTVSINTRLGALFVSYYGFVERKDFWNAAAAAGQIVYSLMEIEKFSEARNAAKIMFANSGGNRLIAAAIGNSFFDYDDETGGEKGYYMLLGAVESDEEFNEIVSCCEQYYPVKPGIDWRSYLATAYMLFFCSYIFRADSVGASQNISATVRTAVVETVNCKP